MENFIKKLLTVIVFLIFCMFATKIINRPQETEQPQEQTEDINKIVIETLEKYYNNIFQEHSSKYCGTIDFEDTYETNYANSKTYNTIEEIKDSYKTFLSENYIEENLIDKYKEKDNKLYCYVRNASTLEYKENSFKITNIIKEDNKINVEGTYETKENDLYPKETFNANITLIKENNFWVIDSYKES